MTPVQTWPIEAVHVDGLFGARSADLELDEALTIVTGENGSGKSTVLTAVHCVAEGQWHTLSELPLSSISLIFRDAHRLEVSKTDQGLDFSLDGRHWSMVLDQFDASVTHEAKLLRARLREPGLSPRQRQLYERRLATRFGQLQLSDMPAWLDDVLDGLNTKSISARRLEHRLSPDSDADGGPESVVDRYARELRELMRIELSRYAAESRQQEKELPSRIVEAMQTPTSDTVSLANEVDQLRQDVRHLADSLARVGLFDEDGDPDSQFQRYPRDNPNILLAIREVYQVAKDRLDRLTVLRKDLVSFADFLNDRFTDKRIELNQVNGISVVLPTGELIQPSDLSSGEQQLLALAYELLFTTPEHSVVLLDEPELSLHVTWLQGLVAAFLEIGRRRKLQFVVATHSPSIVAGHTGREQTLDAS